MDIPIPPLPRGLFPTILPNRQIYAIPVHGAITVAEQMVCHKNFAAIKTQLGIQGHDESVLFDWHCEGSQDIILHPQYNRQIQWYNQTKLKIKLKDNEEDWNVLWWYRKQKLSLIILILNLPPPVSVVIIKRCKGWIFG